MTDTAVDTVVFTFKHIAAPFKADGNVINYKNSAILRHIGDITVLNTSVRGSLTPSETETFDFMMMELMQSGRIIQRVGAFSEFFDGEKQFARVSKLSSSDAAAFVKSMNMNISNDDLAVIQAYESVRARFIEFFSGMKAPYPFATIPDGGTRLTITGEGSSLRITNNSGYNITLRQFTNIWNRCIKVWQDNQTDDGRGVYRRGDYNRHTISINKTHVAVGCQTIDRWKAEQAAISLGLI